MRERILSRITEPTRGHADITGRVGALLEVGTGFHPELTGRENVALNGAILGMRRAEIERKFDDIVSFAGVERFIDTPVKRYSTGMHARLASLSTTTSGRSATALPGTTGCASAAPGCAPSTASPASRSRSPGAFVIEFEYWNLRAGARLNLSLHVYNQQGVLVFNARPAEEAAWQGRAVPRGLFRDTCHVPADLLNDGVHSVELVVVEDAARVIHRMEDVLVFEVRDDDTEGWYAPWAGAVRPRLAWETEQLVTHGMTVGHGG